MRRHTHLLAGTALALVIAHGSLQAAPLKVGSGNEAVIDPAVPHPEETPCVVALATDAKFGASNVDFAYTPPAACPGPWARVVLTMRFSLNQGRQFDRSGQLFLAGVPLWFGTTAEPRATLSPRWAFEKDVTDYTSLFRTAQTGYLIVPNYQSSVYTSTITAGATLSFYPANSAAPAPVTADVVLPLVPGGGLATLNSGTDQLSTTTTLPTNILHATLDLYLQAQIDDEFWYFCVPTALAAQLETCGNTAFREGEITVDGTPAGVAPIYPWIFTGGIDPYLWQPIPGVQTFDFEAFHADLSPFAGVLSNGAPHTIATSVLNADHYFSATGALRLFLDKGATTVTGHVTRNTLRTANPQVTPAITVTDGVSTGTVDVTSMHDFLISGTVTGSAGTQTNSVSEVSRFASHQVFDVSATKELQHTVQDTDTTVIVTSQGAGSKSATLTTLHYPLQIAYDFVTAPNQNSTQTTSVNQQYLATMQSELDGTPTAQDSVTNAVVAGDTLFFNPSFAVTGHKSQSETADYIRTGTSAPCFKRSLVSTFNVLSAVQTGC